MQDAAWPACQGCIWNNKRRYENPHEQQTRAFEGPPAGRHHDAMLRTRRRENEENLYVTPAHHYRTLMGRQVTFKRTITAPIFNKVKNVESEKERRSTTNETCTSQTSGTEYNHIRSDRAARTQFLRINDKNA